MSEYSDWYNEVLRGGPRTESTARDYLRRAGDFRLPQTPEEWAQLRNLELGRVSEEAEHRYREGERARGTNVLGHRGNMGDFYRNAPLFAERYGDEQAWGFQNSWEQQYVDQIARSLGVPPGQAMVAFKNQMLNRLRRGESITRADAAQFAQRSSGDFSGTPGGTPAFQNPARPDGSQWNRNGVSPLRRPRQRPMQPQAYQGAPAQYGQAAQVQPVTQPQRPANPYQNPAQATQPGRTPPTEREQPSYGGTSYADPMQLSSAMGTLGYNATKKTPLDEAMERFR